MPGLFDNVYNPDVLSCLANLSNDEVFTPPEIANQMLDMLPQELFESSETTFLDPACKSGVFLREIAKRLLRAQIPEYEERVRQIEEKRHHDIPLDAGDTFFENILQQKIDHIFHNQLFGIAITELTSLLSRRSLYCSKYPNSEFSITEFDTSEGNVRFRRIEHGWDRSGKCVFCGASKSEYDRESELETHAYEWIHTMKPEDIFDMHFDVIISNPPYQLSDGGSKASAKPIYHLFVEQAKKLNPRYMTMIIPARWFSGGKGLEEFRERMLQDLHINHITDYFDSAECFPGVDISGGICYFLWDRENKKPECVIESHRANAVSKMERPLLEANNDTFIRFNEAISILRKVQSTNESSFSEFISSRKPFGLETTAAISDEKTTSTMISAFAYPKNGYIEESRITQNKDWIDKTKVCISYAYGERGDFPYLVIGKPFVAHKGSCCTETYLVIRAFDDEHRGFADNLISYMTTKFFRFLVLMKKNTQHATKTVYEFVPDQDFSKPWTDEELYAKYGLTADEIAFIDSMIRPMDLGGDTDA